jgi:hypothetical protein
VGKGRGGGEDAETEKEVVAEVGGGTRRWWISSNTESQVRVWEFLGNSLPVAIEEVGGWR